MVMGGLPLVLLCCAVSALRDVPTNDAHGSLQGKPAPGENDGMKATFSAASSILNAQSSLTTDEAGQEVPEADPLSELRAVGQNLLDRAESGKLFEGLKLMTGIVMLIFLAYTMDAKAVVFKTLYGGEMDAEAAAPVQQR